MRFVATLLLLSGCSVSLGVPSAVELSCDNDGQCPGELLCVVGGGFCSPPGGACVEVAEQGLVARPQCDANGVCSRCDDGICVAGRCEPSTCDDGFIDAASGESCDNGRDNSDRPRAAGAVLCRTDCTLARCGDGILDADEVCDDGNADNGDACSNACTMGCGDGVVQAGEVCDDGNTDDCDGTCAGDCGRAVDLFGCGDGVTCPGEECDDGPGNAEAPNTCRPGCTLPACGDGQLDVGDLCDDGNVLDGDYCSSDCQAITGECGDGILQINETCDDGDASPADGCSDRCQAEPYFGCSGTGTTSCRSVLYVDVDAVGDNDGRDWPNAFDDLQAALDAQTDEEIWIAGGTYTPSQTGDRSATFTVTASPLSIWGGFSGEALNFDDDPGSEPTVLDGDLLGDDQPGFVNYDDNSRTVLTLSGGSQSLQRLTIRGANDDAGSGGGITKTGAALTLESVTLAENAAVNGGGIWVSGAELILRDSLLRDNSAQTNGGAIYMTGGSSVNGETTTFSGNAAAGAGGGLYAWLDASPSDSWVRDSVFDNNSADQGGGLYVHTPEAFEVASTTLRNNTATGTGGGAYVSTAGLISTRVPFRLLESRVESNTAGQAGGMFYECASGTESRCAGRIEQSLFVDNVALDGTGGLVAEVREPANGIGSDFRILGATFLDNQRNGGNLLDAHAVSLRGSRDPNIVLRNVIIWGSDPNSHLIALPSIVANTEIMFSLVTNACDVSDPFAPLDASVRCVDPDLDAGFTPSPGSPAIDAGSNADSTYTADLAGNARNVDRVEPDTGAGTAPIIDIGAFEAQ